LVSSIDAALPNAAEWLTGDEPEIMLQHDTGHSGYLASALLAMNDLEVLRLVKACSR
jgi:hypothetical protein